MAPLFGLIKDLQPGKSKIALKLRVIRSYKIPQIQNRDEDYSQELVFHDVEGSRVHGTIQKLSISAFDGMLKEGKVYAIMNFIVARNIKRSTTTSCPYIMNLFKHTLVAEREEDSIPNYHLNLKSFDEIAAMETKPETTLFDVMGVVKESGRPIEITTSSGKTVRLIDILLEDIGKKTIRCKMWENYADELDSYINSGAEEQVAVLLKFCRTSIYRGELTVQNSYHATQILYQNVSELEEMREEFWKINKGNSSGVKMIHVPKPRTMEDELNDGESMLKKISALSAYESGKFWVFGEIYSVEVLGEWSYMACKLCLKKLNKDDHTFFCLHCNTFDVMGRLRYRLTVGIADDSETGKFILWDRECAQLLGIAAGDISVDAANPSMPFEFQSLIGKKALFKIILKQYELELNNAYMISKVNLDPEMIAKYGHIENKNTEEKSEGSNVTDTSTAKAWDAALKRSEANVDEEGAAPIVFKKRSKKVQAEKENVQGEK